MSKKADKAKLEFIRVEWAETYDSLSPTGEFPFTVYSWAHLTKFLRKVYESREPGSGGYSKVKVHIEWVNGDVLIDRIDVGNGAGDYKPSSGTAGEYLRGEGVGHPNRGSMYKSSFQYETEDGSPRGIVTETTRDNVAWTDAENKVGKDVLEYHQEEEEVEGFKDMEKHFDNLYAIVSDQYALWDEGEAVAWGIVAEVSKDYFDSFYRYIRVHGMAGSK